MMGRVKLRVGTALSFTGTILAFVLSWHLTDPTPFTVVVPIAVGGKWWENIQERRNGHAPQKGET